MSFSPFTDQFFLAVTWLGSLVILAPCTVILDIFLHRAGRGREALLLSTGLALSAGLVHALKLLCRRPRPEIGSLLVPMPATWSFPSAHTAQATAFFLVLAILAGRNLPRPAAGLLMASAALVILAVGWSRVYLQVHYVSDVIAGALVGAVAVLAATAAVHGLFR
jgi:undecaprenyl-diphosphatase